MIDICASPEQFAQRIRAANTIFRIGWGVSANGGFVTLHLSEETFIFSDTASKECYIFPKCF